MRLWDWRMLPYLPKGQLLSQKRECDLIWKDIANGKKTNRILINYLWDYEDYECQLANYYVLLEKEFRRRCYEFKFSKCAPTGLLWHDIVKIKEPFKNHHNNRYLLQCFFNLEEKYMRGQKDFSENEYTALKYCLFENGIDVWNF